MPYRPFRELKYINSLGVIVQWIDRHGFNKEIALLQVLLQYPHLFDELLERYNESVLFGMAGDYDQVVRTLARRSLWTVQADSTMMENAAQLILRSADDDAAQVVTPIAINVFKDRVFRACIDMPMKDQLLQMIYRDLENATDEERIDVYQSLHTKCENLLNADIERILTSRKDRDDIEDYMKETVEAQWYGGD